MSEQSEHWDIHMSRTWRKCPKYDILISGCTKNFECKLNGNKPCSSEIGTNTLTFREPIEQIGTGSSELEIIGRNIQQKTTQTILEI